MKNINIALILLMLVVLTPFGLQAQTVFIQAGSNIGVGLPHSRGTECFVVTSSHVLANEQTVTVVGFKGVKEKAVLERTYSEDIAILRVTAQESSSICSDQTEWLDAMLPAENGFKNLEIRGNNGDGSVRIMDGSLSSVDDRYILLRTAHPSDSVFQGMSGSLITSEGHPVGLLAEVHQGNGGEMARGYRIDYLKSLLIAFFTVDAFADLYGSWAGFEPDKELKAGGCKQRYQRRYLMTFEQGGAADGKLEGKVTQIETWTEENLSEKKCFFLNNEKQLVWQFNFTASITPRSKWKFNIHTEYEDCDGPGCKFSSMREQNATLQVNPQGEMRIDGVLGYNTFKKM